MADSLYKIVLSSIAAKQLDKFSDAIAKPIFEAIFDWEKNPRPTSCKKLKGRDGYRIRVGIYRIIYSIIDKELLVEIIQIGHRKDIYKK
jgi:mRNA interferase RelE/StbE